MGDFSQNGIISNLHDFGTKTTADIEKELVKFSKERKFERRDNKNFDRIKRRKKPFRRNQSIQDFFQRIEE